MLAMFALQHVLANQGDHDRVLNSMIKRVAIGDMFKCHTTRPAEHAWILGLEMAIGPSIRHDELVDEGVNQMVGWIEHGLCLMPRPGWCTALVRGQPSRGEKRVSVCHRVQRYRRVKWSCVYIMLKVQAAFDLWRVVTAR